MSPAFAPSPQEIHRKLSVHSVTRMIKSPKINQEGTVSGTESDSDSAMLPGAPSSGLQQQPLSSIAEREAMSGEDTDEDEEGEGGWRSADVKVHPRGSRDEGVIKSGYLWKKGERRKTWKKRWFVLRTAHLAYYKNSAEYKLLRLLELSDIHSCTLVTLKRHENTFGLISPVRTYYLQAKTPGEVREWVQAIEQARLSLQATSTQSSLTSPIPIARRSPSNPYPPIPHSPTALHNMTSSDSDDALPTNYVTYSSPKEVSVVSSTQKKSFGSVPSDLSKIILSGYLMKCGSKRRNWRKRWFTLTGEKLSYSGSHMDTKPHRQFPFSQILDALEYDLQATRHHPPTLASSTSIAPSSTSALSDADDPYATHTFKIITTKRTLLLCAPSEEDEIKWLGAVRALIARRSTGPMSGDTTFPALVPLRSAEGVWTSGSPATGSGGHRSRQPSVSQTSSRRTGSHGEPC